MADDDEAQDRSKVDHLVDLCVYAPLGFALEARSLLPGFIDRGKAQVGVARMVGEFAVKWGSTRVEAAAVDIQEQAMGLLRATGLAPVDDRDRSADAPVAGTATTAAEQPAEGHTGDDEPRADETAETAGAEPSSAAAEDAAPAETGPAEGGAAGDLAIPDYDNLSASQVVPRLEGLTPDELDAVDRYERAHRGRNTILNKVAQLRNPEG